MTSVRSRESQTRRSGLVFYAAAVVLHTVVFVFTIVFVTDETVVQTTKETEDVKPLLILGIKYMEFEIVPIESDSHLSEPESEQKPEPEPEPELELKPIDSESENVAVNEPETPHMPEPDVSSDFGPVQPFSVPFVSEVTTEPPAARNQIRPAYPVGARRRGEEGTVVYEVAINDKGFVTGTDLIRSSGHSELDNAARRALLAARFTPATRGGEPVPFTLQLPIVFKLLD